MCHFVCFSFLPLIAYFLFTVSSLRQMLYPHCWYLQPETGLFSTRFVNTDHADSFSAISQHQPSSNNLSAVHISFLSQSRTLEDSQVLFSLLLTAIFDFLLNMRWSRFESAIWYTYLARSRCLSDSQRPSSVSQLSSVLVDLSHQPSTKNRAFTVELIFLEL